MEVQLKFFATVRETVGERTVTLTVEPGTTIRDVLATLEGEYPDLEGRLLEDGHIAGAITVLRNGTNVVHDQDGDTGLEDGDTLSITPPVTGG